MIRRHLAGIRRTLRGTTRDAEAAVKVTPVVEDMPVEPPQPAVAEMPEQRGWLLPIESIPEPERLAMARVVAGLADDDDRDLVRSYCRFVDLMEAVEDK